MFEEGPTQDFTLQWATYRDAADQTSLSRIWGGIHPPIDDIKGRIIGEKIGKEAYLFAENFFGGNIKNTYNPTTNSAISIFPNPFKSELQVLTSFTDAYKIDIYDVLGKKVFSIQNENSIQLGYLKAGIYYLNISLENGELIRRKKLIKSD
ncbi:T9SS type A sorting domain-containing protein [Polaribacter sp. IC063]|uniref:T9SS type A sorting domain-containing protein n=1 Tax=Polaribacter sp. IC063 TaxID=57031 RepID=UPI002938EFE7|nr:T9SS type A sorting domain-containing protein [Polaribacter sp. IC063]